MNTRHSILKVVLACTVSVAMTLWWLVLTIGQKTFTVNFLNVGHGDAILVQTSRESEILVDGGPGDAVLREVGDILLPWDHHIDIVFVTHYHADHIEGLIKILDHYTVDTLILNSQAYDSPVVDELKKAIDRNQVKTRFLYQGDYLAVDEAEVHVLWPPKGLFCENINDCAYLLLLKNNDYSVLLTSDVEFNGEYKKPILAVLKSIGNIDVLKVPHQGSRLALNEESLRIIDPEVAVLSIGRNPFGHPNIETTQLLRTMKIQTLTTEVSGTISISKQNELIITNTSK